MTVRIFGIEEDNGNEPEPTANSLTRRGLLSCNSETHLGCGGECLEASTISPSAVTAFAFSRRQKFSNVGQRDEGRRRRDGPLGRQAGVMLLLMRLVIASRDLEADAGVA
ncbi:hypothetical protein HPP92_001468 [Vanilla planifolia]|nr:hypothetical protein HPP92_001468 [Vanilla planifolia]